jgi:hypothetical protein
MTNARDLNPGDVVDGRRVVHVRRVKFRDQNAADAVRDAVNNRGLTLDQALKELKLTESVMYE